MYTLGIVGYLVLCIIIGVIAKSRNRSGFWWFLWSIIIDPIIAVILLLILGRR